MSPLDYLGAAAALLTSISFIPQVLKTIRSGDTSSISLLMYTLFVLGVACWLVWGYLLDQMPVMLANLVTLCLSSVILGMKLRAVAMGREKP